MPTEAKNSSPKRSRRGMMSLSAWCPKSDSLSTIPATKAPKAKDSPTRCVA